MADIHGAVVGFLETRGVKPNGQATDKAALYDELREIGLEALRKERNQQQEAIA